LCFIGVFLDARIYLQKENIMILDEDFFSYIEGLRDLANKEEPELCCFTFSVLAYSTACSEML